MIFASITDRCLNPGACTDAHTVNRQAHRLVQNGDHIATKKKEKPMEALVCCFWVIIQCYQHTGVGVVQEAASYHL